MREIPLTQGKFAIVDDADYPILSQYKWCINGGYAARGYHHNGKLHIEKMHHRILGHAPPGFIVDHINGNRFDNRRVNLRFITQQQNTFNSARKIPKLIGAHNSGYKGVTWRNDRNKWRATITKDGKRTYIGLFDTKFEAACAYNERALELFGKYARLNNIQEEQQNV